jgi:hypothetical protein
MVPKWMFIAVAAIIAAALVVSGCTGANRAGNDMMNGADVFNPKSFSMATYVVAHNDSGTLSMSDLIVTAFPGEESGDRLTSVNIAGNYSTRADVWLAMDGSKTEKVLMSDANLTDAMVSGGSPMINITVVDTAWNTLDSSYSLIGRANVSVPAGDFTGCYVYSANKTLSYESKPVTIQVYYFMHPSVSVPVMYAVYRAEGPVMYELTTFYGSSDHDSSPERVIQTYFDYIDQGRYDAASRYIVSYDETSGKFKPLDRDTYDEFATSMEKTYTNESMHLQYVYTASVKPMNDYKGYTVATADFSSLHYSTATLTAYPIGGSFNFVNLGGQWRIIA